MCWGKESSMKKILIICTGNSARSQIAEGLIRTRSGDHIEAFSAGTEPKGMNSLAVEAMKEIGIDISNQYSKDLKQFKNQRFDLVITVCDNAKESCPHFPGAKTIHWSIPDPTDLESFRKVRAQLIVRIEELLKEPSWQR